MLANVNNLALNNPSVSQDSSTQKTTKKLENFTKGLGLKGYIRLR